MRPIAALVEWLPISMRKTLNLASLALFAVFCLGLGGGQNASAEATATVRSVSVSPGTGDFQVTISTSRPITPQTQVITIPYRLVIDFPNALPGAGLHSQAINRGKVKGIRVGLFSAHPPVTRVVVDLEELEPYQIQPSGNSVLVKLTNSGKQPADSPLAHLASAAPVAAGPKPPAQVHPASALHVPRALPATSFSVVRVPLSTNASAAAHNLSPHGTPFGSAPLPGATAASVPFPGAAAGPNPMSANAAVNPAAPSAPPVSAPRMEVDYRNGKLKIVADHATLAAILNEVHRRMGTQISLPSGGGMEQVYVSLGPAAPREVMAALLNGTHFNFIMVGVDNDPSQLRSVILTPSSAGPADTPAPYSPPLAAQAPEYTPPTVPDIPQPDAPPPDDSGNVGVTPDTGEPDTTSQEPEVTTPRRPRPHRPAQEPAEQPQDDQQ